MPKELQERRDNTVLNYLIDIKTELAKNTVETGLLTDQIRTLNGKVAGHETRLQSLETDKAVSAKQESITGDSTSYKKELLRRWTDRVLWGAFTIAMAVLYAVLVKTEIIKDFLN